MKISTEKRRRNLSPLLEESPKAVWVYIFAECAFFITGVCLTLAAFLFLNLFVQQLVRNDFERITENTVSSLSKEFSELERSINTAATLFSMSGASPDDALFQKIAKSDPGIRHFDQVMYMFKKPDGQWEYRNFFKGEEARYAITPNRALINHITGRNYMNDNATHVIMELSLFEVKSFVDTPNAATNPFALMRAVNADSFVIGTGHAENILNDDWRKTHEQILGLSIRDMNDERELFEMRRSGNYKKLEGADRVYEFSFGGHRWQVGTSYVREQKTHFLTLTPYAVLIFGLILTFAGTLYIHGMQRQSMRMVTINAALGQKNKELKNEMIKREQLHSMLRKSEEENQSVIDFVNDIIFETDTTGKILFLNASWQKITGFEAVQSKGLNLFNMLHPQDQKKQRKDFQELVEGKKQSYRSFTRLRTADGTFRAVEISISMLRRDEAKDIRVVGTLTDVEERRRAERALGEAEKKYRTIVENAAGGLFQLTPEGIYLSANPALARILGYQSPEDLLYSVKNANESVYFNMRERQYFLKELEETGAISNYETQVVKKDGTSIWVNENVRAVREEGGATLYYEGSLEDITQRKQADVALKEAKIHSDLANRAKSEFLANMSHELRTPLNAIIGFSEIIRNETFGPLGQDSYKDYARDIHESGKKLLRVISEILDIAKIEAGNRQLNDDVIDLYALVEGAMKLLQGKADAGELVVSNMMKDVPKVVGEELALKQVIVNLLSNAIKFTPSKGRVTITNEMEADGGLRISITDTGIGLDEAEIEKALSPFGQIQNEFNRSNAGSGLGLTLADELMKLHDGKLELFSQKGIGTTITLIFPADRVQKVKLVTMPVKTEKTL